MSAVDVMPNTPYSRLRDNLVALLAARGWTQSELARRSRIAQPTISRIINGRVRGNEWATIEALARALDVDPGELAGGTPAIDAAPEPEVGVVDLGDLLRSYIASHWFQADQPTPEELRWLEQYGEIAWTGAPPGPALVHVILMRRRAGNHSR